MAASWIPRWRDKPVIGARVPRRDDERFLRGEGRSVADLRMPFMVEAVVVRSPNAHARIRSIDIAAAAVAEGVVGIVVGADLPEGLPPIPCRIPSHSDMQPFLQWPLARERVRFVGEPVAVVVAATRALAEDAAELIEIDWEPLPPVASVDDAMRADAPRLHAKGNVASHWGYDLGNVEAAIASAAAVVRDRFTVQRHTAMPLETRGLLAHYDRARRMLEVFGATKVPHTNRARLAAMLGMGEAQIRLAEPDVGGSFGARGEF